MGKYFGTDGFRGEANISLTAKQAFDIGRYLGYHYGNNNGGTGKIVVGKDTRRSSYMFESAIAAGITASGSVLIFFMLQQHQVYLTLRAQSSSTAA